MVVGCVCVCGCDIHPPYRTEREKPCSTHQHFDRRSTETKEAAIVAPTTASAACTRTRLEGKLTTVTVLLPHRTSARSVLAPTVQHVPPSLVDGCPAADPTPESVCPCGASEMERDILKL